MKRKLVWYLFDPFQNDSQAQRSAIKTAAVYAKSISAQIEPVYFADRYRGTDAGSYLFPLFPTLESTQLSDLESIAVKAWETLIKAEKLKTLPLKILTHKNGQVPSLEAKVRAISSEAKCAGVELVVLQTRATSGLKRLVLGSFAETFLLYATVPALLVSKTGKAVSRPKHILFPSDLSASSFLAFKKLAPTLKALQVKVTLLYYLELPKSLVHVLKPREYRSIDLDQFIESARHDLEELAQDFLDLARSFKIKVTFLISSDAQSLSKADAILAKVDELGVDCIALAAQSGELATSIIGATSRAIVRGASCPVFVSRSRS